VCGWSFCPWCIHDFFYRRSVALLFFYIYIYIYIISIILKVHLVSILNPSKNDVTIKITI
jgi:hypothetical protein